MGRGIEKIVSTIFSGEQKGPAKRGRKLRGIFEGGLDPRL